MCNKSCLTFGRLHLLKDDIEGKTVIEIGSYDVNGSLRSVIAPLKPAAYIGTDIQPGPGVDVICPAEQILEKFGARQFDVVVSTELLEHVRNWRKVISNFKHICKPGGIILLTTRSRGFPCHAYPYDFWRYEIDDMKQIFADCIIEKLEKDNYDVGVLVKVRRPAMLKEIDLSAYALYSIITDSRVRDVENSDVDEFYRKFMRCRALKYAFGRFKHIIKTLVGLR